MCRISAINIPESQSERASSVSCRSSTEQIEGSGSEREETTDQENVECVTKLNIYIAEVGWKGIKKLHEVLLHTHKHCTYMYTC